MWRKTYHLAVLGFILFAPFQLIAHPVAYKGAWSFMAFNQSDMLDWQLLYSFERKFSAGLDFYRDTMAGPERLFLIPRLSWLVNRWNGSDSQTNIYVYGGIGALRTQSDTRWAAEGSLEADYETRQVYFSGKATAVAAKNTQTLAVYQARAGFAPYEGGFEELNAWLIGQFQYFPFANDEQIRVGPFLRLFYRSVLWELGTTTKGDLNFNFMVHF